MEEKKNVEEQEDILTFEDAEETSEKVEEPKVEEPKAEEEKKVVEPSKQQSSRENREQKQKRLLHEQYVKGQIDAIKVNPFTNKEIKNERDLKIYQKMKEAKESGVEDVISQGYEEYFGEIDQEEKSKVQKDEQIKKQLAELKEVVPDFKARQELMADADFRDIYEEIIVSGGSIKKAATTFMKLKNQSKPKENVDYQKGREMIDQPSANNGAEPKKKSLDDLTEAEIHNLFLNTKFGS